MKRILPAVILGVALFAGAAFAQQAAPQPAPPAPRPPVTVLPPPRPQTFEIKSAPAQAPAAPAPQRSDREIIALANAYLNGVSTMIADFTQVAGDGRRSEGSLSIQKPGRMRFEYNPPATIEVVADGTSLAIRDRKLKTQDLYALWQTPLKFLLKDQIDLTRDTRVLQIDQNPHSTVIYIEDKATLGGTSRIRLVFDPHSFELKQWTVTDPQGYDTLVSLFNVDLATKPNPASFRINAERMLNTNRN